MLRITAVDATIRVVRLNGLDLNLLVTLDALLQDVSVTRAAARLSVTQPAVSASLARLRRHFDDELLHRVGNSYELTPLAFDLRDLTAAAVAAAQRVFDAQSQARFDPAGSDREFALFGSDYAMAVLAPIVAGLLRDRAPGARLRIQRSTQRHLDHAEEMLRTIDGQLLPHGYVAGLPHLNLYEDGWRVIVAPDNERVGAKLTLDDLRALPWASVYQGQANTPAGRQLQTLGIEARVEVVVESFLALPYVVAGSDRVALVQAQLAARMAAGGQVRALPCPFDATPLVEALWWHPLYDRDPGHQWLRGVLRESGALLGAQTWQASGRPPVKATMSANAARASNGSPSSA